MSEIRDPIYGFISPSDTELKIINTEVFQRLRKIKQLAMAYLVYPGAQHTRFDHSLGVFHVAGAIAERVLPGHQNEAKRNLIRLSALLHDIGHGPFSHVSEEVLNRFSLLPSGTNIEKIHEKITYEIIKSDKQLKRLISSEDIESIVGLLSGSKLDLSLLKNIVSGPLDADKMDYLLRDGYFCGVKYGVFDLDRMLNVLTSVDEPGSSDSYLGIKNDGINTLEQYFLAKYYMTTQVYFHKVRKVTDAMIVRGLELGIEKDEIKELKKLFEFVPGDSFMNNYLEYWDDRLICNLMYSIKPTHARDIFRRLFSRKLFKTVFSKKITELSFNKETTRDILTNINKPNNRATKTAFEHLLSRDILKCEPEYVILKSTMIKSVKEMARDSEETILIQGERDNPPKFFEQESTIFKAIDEKLKDIIVEVYAPMDFPDLLQKNKQLSEYEKQISTVFQTYGG